MAKKPEPLYVTATQSGYYGGLRQAGSRFWIADKSEFSKKWMVEADPGEAQEPAPEPLDGATSEEQAKQVEQLIAAAADSAAALEAVEAERDQFKANLESADTQILALQQKIDELEGKQSGGGSSGDGGKAGGSK